MRKVLYLRTIPSTIILHLNWLPWAIIIKVLLVTWRDGVLIRPCWCLIKIRIISCYFVIRKFLSHRILGCWEVLLLVHLILLLLNLIMLVKQCVINRNLSWKLMRWDWTYSLTLLFLTKCSIKWRNIVSVSWMETSWVALTWLRDISSLLYCVGKVLRNCWRW